MIYVKVPKEIKEYEEKILFNLSIRQLIFGGISISLGVGFYFLMINFCHVPSQIASYIVMIVVVPGFACGWIEIHGMKFDKYLKIVYSFYSRKQKLKYSDECYLWDKKGAANNATKKQKRSRSKEKKHVKETDY